MFCAMCKNPAIYLVNGALPLCGECFDPSDPDVVALEAEGMQWETLPDSDAQARYNDTDREEG